MLVYIFTFIISISFSYLAEKKTGISRYVFSFFALLFPILLRGLRDFEVGIDTSAYPLEAYDLLKNGFSWEILLNSSLELGYLLLSYVSISIVDIPQSILLATQLIIMVNFFVAFMNMRTISPLWLSMFFFYLFFFNAFLNIQRQGLAMSFVILGVVFLLQEKLMKFLLFVCVAFLFHKSALVSLLLIPIFYVKENKINKYTITLCLLLVIGNVFFLQILSELLQTSKYEQYAGGNDWGGGFSFSEFIVRTTFLCALYFCTPKYRRNIVYNNVLCLFICEYILNLMQIVSKYGGRIGWYFFSLSLLFLPFYFLLNKKHEIKRNRLILIMGLSCFYWWYVVVISKAGETYPYSSAILGL